jgi:hypothetical protein
MSTKVAVPASIEHYDYVPGKKSTESRLRELDGWL